MWVAGSIAGALTLLVVLIGLYGPPHLQPMFPNLMAWLGALALAWFVSLFCGAIINSWVKTEGQPLVEHGVPYREQQVTQFFWVHVPLVLGLLMLFLRCGMHVPMRCSCFKR